MTRTSLDTHRCAVISPREVNVLGMCLTVVVTTGVQFARKAGLAVNITAHETNGVALCDHVRSFDILSRIRQKTARYIDTLDGDAVDELVAKVVGIIEAN